MFEKIKWKLIVILFSTIIIGGCVSPGAVKAQLGSLENDMSGLQKIADELLKWQSNIQAETINYGGGGWIVLGSAVLVIIFLSAFGFLIRMLMNKMNLLKLVTCAVQKTGNGISRVVKDQIEKEIKSNSTSFTERDKNKLAKFTKKIGTFANDFDKS